MLSTANSIIDYAGVGERIFWMRGSGAVVRSIGLIDAGCRHSRWTWAYPLITAALTACASAQSLDLQPELKAAFAEIQTEERTCNVPQRLTATEVVVCQQQVEKKVVSENAPYLLDAIDAYSAKRQAAAQWLDREDAIAIAASRRFSAKFSEAIAVLQQQEPLFKSQTSTLRKRIADANPFVACKNYEVHRERMDCVKNIVTPIWTQEAPGSLAYLDDAYQTIARAAIELDNSGTTVIYRANSPKFMTMIGQYKSELARDAKAAIAVEQQRIAARNAQSQADAAETRRQIGEVVAAFVDVIGAVAVRTEEGYASANAARPTTTTINVQSAPVHCTTQYINNFAYTNCN
jgi:hypothetical protein